MEYQVKAFEALSTQEFWQIAQARTAVFVVEQECPYQEIDEVDPEALHTWLVGENREVAAYTRIYLEDGVPHIGRVLTTAAYRGQGLGQVVMAKSIAAVQEAFPEAEKILIGAQARLQKFYQEFGFRPISAVYLEDDIPHIEMELSLK